MQKFFFDRFLSKYTSFHFFLLVCCKLEENQASSLQPDI